ncbi:MAG: DUF4346 domain-containing protein [Oscillospiraceae bacterium]|jgi:hypothetical protein
MRITAETVSGVKAVAVAEKGSSSAALLKNIFRICGHEDYRVVKYGNMLPKGMVKPVLLLCMRMNGIDVKKWAVCVAERELSEYVQGAAKRITFSLKRNDADFTARNIRITPDGNTTFEIVGFGVIGRVRLRGSDLSKVEAVMAAACAAVGCGIPFAEVLSTLNQSQPRKYFPALNNV